MKRPLVLVVAALAAQALLVGAAVAPQLSARTGEEYRFAVAPLDPIDPFRGAYVALAYPDLQVGAPSPTDIVDPEDLPPRGQVFVPLETNGLTRGGTPVTTRPDSGPYLTCHSTGWEIDCGVHSWFVDQEQARELERHLDGAVAVVRVDDRGRAALVDLIPAS
ncbi:MAG: GDYXXLXY domain-containing protein [Mobilicoccus sp.]|nr:GDYXXLXY domain-containing protein [Mobilicoccus sp.]